MVFNFHIYLNKLSLLYILLLWTYIILFIINGLCPFYVTIMSEIFYNLIMIFIIHIY